MLFQDPPGSLQLVPVTRIEQLVKRTGGGGVEEWIGKSQMGWLTKLGRFCVAVAIGRNIRKVFRQLQVGQLRTDLGWKRIGSHTDGSEKTCQGCWIQELVAPRIHSDQPSLSRLDANAELVIGWCRVQTSKCL